MPLSEAMWEVRGNSVPLAAWDHPEAAMDVVGQEGRKRIKKAKEKGGMQFAINSLT